MALSKGKLYKPDILTFTTIFEKEFSVNINCVLFVMSYGKYSKIYYVLDGSANLDVCVLKSSLKDFESQYQNMMFFRIHKQYIVNMLNIKNYGIYPKPKVTVFKNNLSEDLPISRNIKLLFHQTYTKFIQKTY